MESKKVISRIIDLYRFYGRVQNEGQITPLEHALQVADMASADGWDNEVVAAAFLHDIGYLLALEQCTAYCAVASERSGADYLLDLGFPMRVTRLVAGLIQAKRYLCAIEPGYYEQLSQQSQESLSWQGGAMSIEEVSEFSCRNDLEEVLALCCYDQEADKPEVATDGLRYIERVLAQVLEPQAQAVGMDM